MDKTFVIGHIEHAMDLTIMDVKWLPRTARLAVVGNRPNGRGVIEILELNEGKLSSVRRIEREDRVKSGSFGASLLRRHHFAVGTFDGRLEVYDVERGASDGAVFEVEAHKGAMVNCVDGVGGGLMVSCGAPEIATGSSDGFVKIWDTRQKSDPVACLTPLREAKNHFATRECWTVAFGNSFDNDNRVLCAGYDNGDIKMFDLRQMKIVFEENNKNGIVNIEFDRRDIMMNKMAVATLEGGLGVYDLRTRHSEKGFASVWERDAGKALGSYGCVQGAKSTVWCVRHLPQNREVFASCGGTGTIRLWLYEYPKRRFKEGFDGGRQGVAGTLKLLHATCVSTQPVNCLDWHQDRIGLAACGSFDQTVRILLATNLHLL